MPDGDVFTLQAVDHDPWGPPPGDPYAAPPGGQSAQDAQLAATMTHRGDTRPPLDTASRAALLLMDTPRRVVQGAYTTGMEALDAATGMALPPTQQSSDYSPEERMAKAGWEAGKLGWASAMPGGMFAGVPMRAGEAALGAGPLRGVGGAAAGGVELPHAAETAASDAATGRGTALRGGGGAARAEGVPETPATPAGGGGEVLGAPPGGGGALEEAHADRARLAAGRPNLVGLPTQGFTLGGKPYVPGPVGFIHDLADDYMQGAGLPYNPPKTYAPVDTARAGRIAQAFEEMPHNPADPATAASYDAMINETLAQYQAIKKAGIKLEFIKPGQPNPYEESPRLAQQDLEQNHHLWVFQTDQGFGSSAAQLENNPLLRPTKEFIDGERLVANDVFRIVHDVFGHMKDGNGFRAAGEENAWRSHAAMYSDLARPAMTTETRGQNSWLNYGPYGEANRTAKSADTVYADQKIGLLPDWAINEGRADAPAAVTSPAIAGRQQLTTPEGLPVQGSAFSKASREALDAIKQMPKGAGPLDLSGNLRSDVPQVPVPRYEPPRGLSPRLQDAINNPNVIRGIRQSMQQGIAMGADKWYHNEPVRKAFIEELGDADGAREFARFMDYTAATSPRSDVPTNIRNASYYYLMTGRELPENLPYPYGHIAQALHRGNIGKLEAAAQGGTVGAQGSPQFRGWDIFANPKPVSFSEDLQGNLIPVAADTHAMRNLAMRTGDPRWLQSSISELIPPGGNPSNFQRAFGEIKQTPRGQIVTYRPRDLVESGRMTMKDAKAVPPFWTAQPTQGEYGGVEQLYGNIAKRLGLAPAEGQSAAWSGAGKLTGLGTVPDLTFAQMFNNRVLYTAMMRGEKPEQTLRAFIRKQKPLLGFGGAGLLGASMAGGGDSNARQQ